MGRSSQLSEGLLYSDVLIALVKLLQLERLNGNYVG